MLILSNETPFNMLLKQPLIKHFPYDVTLKNQPHFLRFAKYLPFKGNAQFVQKVTFEPLMHFK